MNGNQPGPTLTPQRKNVCSNCQHYNPSMRKVGEGECRAHPPKANIIVHPGGIIVKADFPPVVPTEWCSEHAAKILA